MGADFESSFVGVGHKRELPTRARKLVEREPVLAVAVAWRRVASRGVVVVVVMVERSGATAKK